MRVRRDVDDTGRSTARERVVQQVRQQEVAEVVDLELGLVAVDRHDALAQYDARVVEQNVEPIVLRRERVGERAHRRERREVDGHRLDPHRQQ